MSQYIPGTLYTAERNMGMTLQERHQWAEDRRLRRQCKKGHKSAQRFYFEALASLGYRLASWGEWLQERYKSEGSTQAA